MDLALISMFRPGLPLPRGQSFAHITISLTGLVIWDLSPTMSCQWASVSSGLWCSSGLIPILCPLSRDVLPGRPSRATFAGAPFAMHELWAMSSIVCLIALISVTSGPISWPVQRRCGVHAYVHVAQGPEVCLSLFHCLAAEGSDMKTISSS